MKGVIYSLKREYRAYSFIVHVVFAFQNSYATMKSGSKDGILFKRQFRVLFDIRFRVHIFNL